MTEGPQGSEVPAGTPDTPDAPRGGVFDDDSLADAMAAEVAAYTLPLPLPDREGAGPSAADPFPGGSTLDAIERLEQELRRLSGHSGPVDATAATVPPTAPAGEPATAVNPEVPADPAPPSQPEAGSPGAPAAVPATGSVPTEGGDDRPTPAAVDPDAPPGPVFPRPYQPFSPSPPPPFAPPPLVSPEELRAADAGDPTPAAVPASGDDDRPAEPAHWSESVRGVHAAPETDATDQTDRDAGAEPEPEDTPGRPHPPRHQAAPVRPPELIEPVATGSARFDVSSLPPPIGIEPAPLPPHAAELDVSTLPPPTGPAVAIPPPPRTGSIDRSDVSAPESHAPEGVDELDDDEQVDDIDRMPPPSGLAVESSADTPAVPAGPIPTARFGAPSAAAAVPHPLPALAIEAAGPEPTALDLRAGRTTRLFWLWFAANSSVVSLAVGATLFQLGMSLRQAIVATLAGVAISFLPLGLGTLAGKWSGQPTMVVSRATFGVVGNVVPAALALLSRAFWGGVLLWLLAAAVGRVLTDAGLDAGLGETLWTLIGLVVGFVIATAIAVFGYGLVVRLQLVLSILTGILVVGTIAVTSTHVDLDAALTTGDGPWILVVTGAVLVFSFLGLAWVHSSSDLARYQRPSGYGSTSMLWATFGATLPAFLLIGWGAMLAASDPEVADGLVTAPLHTIAALVPNWYPAPLLLAAGLGLLSGAVLTIYSGGFAVQAVGIRVHRHLATLIAAAPVLAVGAILAFLVPDARELLRDLATTLAVPVAAWAGIFAAEMMIRTRRFHAPSLLGRGGVYPDVRWVNLVALVAISALGFGLTSAVVPGLEWQGFLFPLFGLRAEDPLAASDVGVFVALILGLLVPIVSAIPAIRKQESERV